VPVGPQGYKVVAVNDTGQFPTAVPLTALRVGDREIVTVPGEMTSGMGRILRRTVLEAAAGSGIRRVVISGLANDFVQYVTAPLEYDRQHYEGGSTLFGRAEGIFIAERLAELTSDLVHGEPAPAPDPMDPRNGVVDDAAGFGPGAARGRIAAQPRSVRRLGHATFSWVGGPRGRDRPLDRAFVTIQRRTPRGWRRATDDLGLQILWSVEGNRYRAIWEPSHRARAGRYRFRITANRYRLVSRPFRVRRTEELLPHVVAVKPRGVVIALLYPKAVENADFTWRPARAARGTLIAEVNGRRVKVRGRRGVFLVPTPANAGVTIGQRAARDRFGNRNRSALALVVSGGTG
jgi:neutral ceramidase